jgi:hypothetical protein
MHPLQGFEHHLVVTGLVTNGIRVGRVASEQISLAAAAAIIGASLGTTAAGLLHPRLSAKAIEGG